MTESKYDDGYTHEALHTVYVLNNTFDEHILNSRCANEFSDVKVLAERINSLMCDLYQLIGNKFDE